MTDEPHKSPPGMATRFKPGSPGRKPGSRNRVTEMAEKLMNDDAESIVAAVIAAARGGDMTAARLVLDRIAPVRKGRAVTLDLPKITCAADVSEAMSAVVTAMASAEISPEEAGTIGAVLEIRRKSIETEDLEARIASLETRT